MEEALDKELEGDAVPKRSSSSIPSLSKSSEEAIDVGVVDSIRDAGFHRAGGTTPTSFEEEEEEEGSF